MAVFRGLGETAAIEVATRTGSTVSVTVDEVFASNFPSPP